MRRFTRFAALLTVVVVVMAGVSPASGKGHEPKEVPFKGTTVSVEWGRFLPEDPDFPAECDGYTWYFFASGTGNVTHLGKVDFELGHCTAEISEEFVVWEGGTITFTAANGDTLEIAESGESELFFPNPGPPTGFTYVGEWEVVDGTGRFVHAAGSGDFDGFGDIPGDVVIDFTGMISYDASDGAK